MWFKWLLIGLFFLSGLMAILNEKNTRGVAALTAIVDLLLVLGTLHYWGATS